MLTDYVCVAKSLISCSLLNKVKVVPFMICNLFSYLFSVIQASSSSLMIFCNFIEEIASINKRRDEEDSLFTLIALILFFEMFSQELMFRINNIFVTIWIVLLSWNRLFYGSTWLLFNVLGVLAISFVLSLIRIFFLHWKVCFFNESHEHILNDTMFRIIMR